MHHQDEWPATSLKDIPRPEQGTGQSSLESEFSDSSESTPPHRSLSASMSAGKRVRFENRIRVKEVRHRNDMSSEMITSMWLTMEDYLTCKEAIRRTIRLMMANEIVDEDCDGLCTRGLEGRTRDGSAYRTKKKDAVKRIVLFEQQQQWREGIVDEERIALLCSAQSAQCTLDARMMAMLDSQNP